MRLCQGGGYRTKQAWPAYVSSQKGMQGSDMRAGAYLSLEDIALCRGGGVQDQASMASLCQLPERDAGLGHESWCLPIPPRSLKDHAM